MKNRALIIFIIIILLGLAIRLVGINRPLVGNFSSRQVLYAMVARNFIDCGYKFFSPTLDIIRNGSPWVNYADLPFISYIAGVASHLSGFTIDFCGRSLSVFFFLLSLILLFKLCKFLWGDNIALFASFFFCICPSAIIYGQSFLMDMPAVCFSISAIYYALLWQHKKDIRYFLFSSCAMALGMLLRLQVAFLILPIITIFSKDQKDIRTLLFKPHIYLYLSIAFVVPLSWYTYGYIMAAKLESAASIIPLTAKVYGRGFPDPLFFNPDFYRRVLDMYSTKVLGPFIFIFFVFGIFLKKIWSEFRFVGFWFLAVALFFILFPLKLYDLNYYSLHMTVPACIIAALMAKTLWGNIKNIPYFSSYFIKSAIIIIIVGSCVRYAVAPAFRTPAEDKNLVKTGLIADELLPKEAFILTVHGTNPALLYYSHRKGWPFYVRGLDPQTPGTKSKMLTEGELILNPIETLKKRIEEGASYLVVLDKEELSANSEVYGYVRSKFKLIYNDKNAVIYEI